MTQMSADRTDSDPTEGYLPGLIAGETQGLLGHFAGEPRVDDPLAGRVSGAPAFERFVRQRQAWLAERSARLEPLRVTRADGRSVCEALLHLRQEKQPIELPIAVVGLVNPDGRLHAVRVYHSLWPLYGRHRVREPLLGHNPSLRLAGVIAEYQEALRAGDVEAITATFEPDGYFREPAGGEYVYRGREAVRAFMAHLLASGGIRLEHCTATDDGVACAIEFNAVQFGKQRLTPQAGVAVYERGRSGRLSGARIYDDVNVEALAGLVFGSGSRDDGN
jgi:hypothetical protein